MAMQMYLSFLLCESSAKTIVLVRDDAKVEQHRRSRFNDCMEQTDTCPWKPLSKSRAPTLPARTSSCEDLDALVECGGQSSLVSSNLSAGDDDYLFGGGVDDYPEEQFDLNPFNTLSKVFLSQMPEEDCLDSPMSLHPRTLSLGGILTRSPIPLDPKSTRSSWPITLSHTQHLNLYGKVGKAGGSSCGKGRNASTEAPPVIPFRKQSIDDLSRSSKQGKRKQELVEGLGNSILNFTWEPLHDEQATSKGLQLLY
mmetsp:Transcript_439/g.654  ORF Transcript_439/g.654 Transcript_439/m.654 type:complete len:254 (-) Transcript_439:308-1069(-)